VAGSKSQNDGKIKPRQQDAFFNGGKNEVKDSDLCERFRSKGSPSGNSVLSGGGGWKTKEGKKRINLNGQEHPSRKHHGPSVSAGKRPSPVSPWPGRKKEKKDVARHVCPDRKRRVQRSVWGAGGELPVWKVL